MRVKKSLGRVYGAELTAAERKAMNIEIEKQLAEYTRKHQAEFDALVLWELHIQLGWGEKRLRKFFDAFGGAVNALVKRYEMEDEDDVWLCTQKLKEMGVDIEQWEREKE